jgi:hypothetical protein
MSYISKYNDTIESSDIEERISELEEELNDTVGYPYEDDDEFTEVNSNTPPVGHESEYDELNILRDLLEECNCNSSFTLISEDYFPTYAENYARDMGNDFSSWPYNCIDWKEASEELLQDYTSVDFDGQTYYMSQY